MTRTKEKKNGNQKGVYGRLPLSSKKMSKSPKSREQEKTPTSSKKGSSAMSPSSSAASLKKSKKESAAKNAMDNNKSSKMKLKPAKANHDRKSSKYHVGGRKGASTKSLKMTTFSINERVAISKKSATKPKKSGSNHSFSELRYGLYQTGRDTGDGASTKKKGKRNRGMPALFRMSINDTSNNLYLLARVAPWYKAEESEKFRDNYSSFTIDKEFRFGRGEDDSEEGFNDGPEHGSIAVNGDEKETFQMPSERVLSEIDAEIQSFCAYVKLTPSERNARSSFMEHIAEIAVNQLGDYRQRRKGKHSYLGKNKIFDHYENSSNDDEQIRVSPFGSFATQEVCTFASDVDLCLWGVVKDERKRELQFIADENETGCNDRVEDVDDNSGQILQHENGLLLTESSLIRTMDAIQAAARTEYERTDGRTVSVNTAEEQESSEPHNPQPEASETADDSLFFIDRVGEGVDSDYDAVAEEVENTTSEEGISDQEVNSNDKTIKASESRPSHCEHANMRGEYCNDNAVETSEKVEKNATFARRSGDNVDGVNEFGRNLENLNENSQSSNMKDEQNFKKNIRVIGAKNEEDDVGKGRQTYLEEKPDENNIFPPKESDEPYSDPQFEELEHGTFSLYRNSVANVMGVDDDSCSNEEVIIDDDDDDSADKLSAFYSRHKASSDTNTRNDGENQASDVLEIILSSDSENSVELINHSVTNHSENAVMELSLTSDTLNLDASSNSIMKPNFGPTGKTRNEVISVLLRLTNHLRKSSFTHTIECRSRAKVPIINCSTRTGFEGDIAIGGHNGVDTSQYAFSQVNRFISFAPIVLLLKIIMFQQGLDKPFTGGLGSYKLYVLVAYHIEQHLVRGGKDRPSEILISLLFRYGCVGDCDRTTTDLESLKIRQELVSSDGGICDLSNAFRIADCVGMFNECYKRLLERVDQANKLDKTRDGGNYKSISYLSSIIDCFRLKQARDASERRSSFCDGIRRPTARDDSGKVNPGRRIGQVFTKHGLNRTPPNSKPEATATNKSSNKRVRLSNDSESPSSAKGNFKRGPRGGIIPSYRPDIDAKLSLRSKPNSELMQRASKNRKNKKKQARDDALRKYASRHSI